MDESLSEQWVCADLCEADRLVNRHPQGVVHHNSGQYLEDWCGQVTGGLNAWHSCAAFFCYNSQIHHHKSCREWTLAYALCERVDEASG
jgi:hypothetical protein